MKIEILNVIIKNDYIQFLAILIAFDYLTGNIKAFKWKVTDSSVGLKGIIKHVITFLSYFFILYFFTYVNLPEIGMLFVYLILLNYVLSILENIAVMGVYTPKFLKSKVLQELKRYQDKLGLGEDENGKENL